MGSIAHMGSMQKHSPRDWTEELSEDLIPPEASRVDDDDVDVPHELEEWKDETKGVERIISVALTTSKPRTVEWIAKQALVAEQTARDHLKMFADLGVIASYTSSGVTKYHADEAFIHYREVSRCAKQYTKEELSEEIEQTQSAIADIRESYGVSSGDDLRAKAAGDDVDTDDLRDFKKTAAELETLRDRLKVLEDAMRRFDKLERPTAAKV